MFNNDNINKVDKSFFMYQIVQVIILNCMN